MNAFIKRLLAVSDPEQMKVSSTVGVPFLMSIELLGWICA
jgi:hypothetical protein